MATRLISKITIPPRFRKDLGNLDELAASIADVGLLHPIVITPASRLIAGARRLEACRCLGWRGVPVTIVNVNDCVRAEHDENIVRKNFLPSEAVAIRQAVFEAEQRAARSRQGTRNNKLHAQFAGSWGTTRDRIATYTGTSGWTLEKATKVVEAAARDPERYGHLVLLMDRSGHIDGAYRQMIVLEQAEQILEPDNCPYRASVTTLHGDALAVLKTFPSNSVDCVVTSPPYWALRDYGVSGQLGLEPTFHEYITKLCDIFDEVQRVLKPQGTCWVNIGDTYGGTGSKGDSTDPKYAEGRNGQRVSITQGLMNKSLIQIPSRFAIEMSNRGWILRNEIIWHKPNCMPASVNDRFTVDFEKLFFFVKSTRYFFDQQYEPLAESSVQRINPSRDGRNKRCVWTLRTKPYPEAHFAVYPPELVETPICAGCPSGGLVLDPFMGSGTTAHVAQRFGRRFVGIEMNAEYLKLAYDRVAPPLSVTRRAGGKHM